MAQNSDTDRVNGRSCDRADEVSEEQSFEKEERKRSRNDETVDNEIPSKRPRYDGQDSSFSARMTPNTADAIPAGRSQESVTAASRVVRGRKLASGKPGLTTWERRGVNSQPRKNQSPDVSKRRSARLAEREERLRAAVVAPFGTIRTPRQRTAKLTRVPTPRQLSGNGGY